MAPHNRNTVPGEWVVLLKPYVSVTGKDSHVQSINGMTAETTGEHARFCCETQFQFDMDECRGYSGKFNLESKEKIEKMDEVLSVEPVSYFKHCQRVTQRNATWGLERISQARQVQPNEPYRYTYPDHAQGQKTVAYIIDTGINKNHEEFQGRLLPGRTFVTSNHPTSEDDTLGHGTHVAGTVGGTMYGVAKSVEIVPVKVFSDITGTARNDDIIQALAWVVYDARSRGKIGSGTSQAVVNMSLGGSYSPALNAAVAATVRSGVVVCVAAGNEVALAEGGSPASEPLAITVAAMDKTDTISDFSNYGRLVDVFAPGTDITSSWKGSATAINTISGTSMATPHVAGLACCILSDDALADRTPYGVFSAIVIRADKNALRGLDRVTSNTLAQV